MTDRFDRQSLHPRLLFQDRLATALEQASRDGGRIALICLDAEDAQTLGATCQQQDRGFLWVEVPGRGGSDITEAVRRRLGQAATTAGIAVFPDHAQDPTGLSSAAAAAFDLAAPGRSRLATPAEAEDDSPRPGHEQLALYFQPQIELVGGRAFGAEALARFTDGSRTRRDAAGRTQKVPDGQDETFVFWTLERAVAELGVWRESGLPGLRLAVNLPLELAESADLPGRIGALLAAAAVPPGCLEIELTEQRPSLDLDAVAKIFEELRALGVRLALDDFGTGFASLSLFERLPFDTLKLDLSYVAALDAEVGRDDAAHLVSDIIGLARQRGVAVIAEGVERATQLDVLRRLGCDACQGYLFSPPVSGAALVEIVSAETAFPVAVQPK